jgi:hypothetical protein
MIISGFTFTAQPEMLAVAAAAEAFISILTGPSPVIIVAQEYQSSEVVGTVSLYEVAATGGTAPRQTPRNLASTEAAPATVRQGATVTPNTPLLRTAFRAPTGVFNRMVANTETDQIVLKPNTQYVIGVLNGGAAAADIRASITYRRVVGQQ